MVMQSLSLDKFQNPFCNCPLVTSVNELPLKERNNGPKNKRMRTSKFKAKKTAIGQAVFGKYKTGGPNRKSLCWGRSAKELGEYLHEEVEQGHAMPSVFKSIFCYDCC